MCETPTPNMPKLTPLLSHNSVGLSPARHENDVIEPVGSWEIDVMPTVVLVVPDVASAFVFSPASGVCASGQMLLSDNFFIVSLDT